MPTQTIQYEVAPNPGNPWGLGQINAINIPIPPTSASYAYANGAPDVDIVIMDLYRTEYHSEFTGRIFALPGFEDSLVAAGTLPVEESHAMKCASSAAGATCGPAKEARIYVCRAASNSECLNCLAATLSFHNKKDRASFRPTVFCSSLGISELATLGAEMIAVCQALSASGVPIFLSAGNQGTLMPTDRLSSACLAATACGSINIVGKMSIFSNCGPRVGAWAPGEEIKAATPGPNGTSFENFSGTSAATPTVSGIAARFKQINKHSSGSDVYDWLQSTSRRNQINFESPGLTTPAFNAFIGDSINGRLYAPEVIT